MEYGFARWLSSKSEISNINYFQGKALPSEANALAGDLQRS